MALAVRVSGRMLINIITLSVKNNLFASSFNTKANNPTFDDSSCRLSQAPRPTRPAGRQTRPADSAFRRTVSVNILIRAVESDFKKSNKSRMPKSF